MRKPKTLIFWYLLSAAVFNSTTATAEAQPLGNECMEAGGGLRFMPIGWFDLGDQPGRKFRAYPALGGQLFFDYKLSQMLSLGVSGEITGNVIPNRSDYQVGTMYTGSVRFSARYPTEKRWQPFVMVTVGYSRIALSSSNASGLAVSGWTGLRLNLTTRHRIFAQAGYEMGLQQLDGNNYAPSYLITELGWLITFG
jgi:hypothetical protein